MNKWTRSERQAWGKSHKALRVMVSSTASLHSGWPGAELGLALGYWRIKYVSGGGAEAVDFDTPSSWGLSPEACVQSLNNQEWLTPACRGIYWFLPLTDQNASHVPHPSSSTSSTRTSLSSPDATPTHAGDPDLNLPRLTQGCVFISSAAEIPLVLGPQVHPLALKMLCLLSVPTAAAFPRPYPACPWVSWAWEWEAPGT